MLGLMAAMMVAAGAPAASDCAELARARAMLAPGIA